MSHDSQWLVFVVASAAVVVAAVVVVVAAVFAIVAISMHERTR